MRHLVYNDLYSVVPINSSLLIFKILLLGYNNIQL